MLLDTSGLLSYLDDGDAYHEDAVTLLRSTPLRLTHGDVLAEFVPLCHSRGLPRTRAIAFVTDMIDSDYFRVYSVEPSTHRAALALLQRRLDKTYSLCDAVSFLLMRQWGLTEALTTDRHFEQEGFEQLLK